MVLGILKESGNEKRVALLPEGITSLVKSNKVLIEKGAGDSCFSTDRDYENAGAEVMSRSEILDKAQIIIKISASAEYTSTLKAGQVLISVMNPLVNRELVTGLKEKGITSFSLDAIPRTTRAQAMDVLSSMATVAGYKSVLLAAGKLPKFFPMFMSAAGTIKPAKVLILGAGVAGLQAIATSRKLGAVVEVFDVRSAVKEEVLSLGGKFIEVEGAKEDKGAGGYAVEQTEEFKQKQAQLIQEHAMKADVVICTAQIPGKKAPVLIKKQTVDEMKPGAVIVDLAASSGGNCEVTKNNEEIEHKGVTIIGDSNLPSGMPVDASRMFGKNLLNFLNNMIDDEGKLNIDFQDEIIKQSCITHQKEIINERIKESFK
jgi:NAD(P) transhydrogenase subunit alpha